MSYEETHYKLLKILAEEPGISQRALSQKLGISLGKTNYCIKALIEKGLIKAGNFKANSHKRNYAYLLTPKGAAAKASAAVRFLKRKRAEYEQLKSEIEQLEQEITVTDKPSS